MNDLPAQIEALLFALGRPLSRKELAQKLSVSGEALEEALLILGGRQSGVALVDDGGEVALRTAPEMSELVERVRKEEYTKEIGKAGLEALSAILYRGPLTRSEIDFIRGVNSTQTLRTLTVRGLVRKVPNPKDERSFLYEPTTELLAHLGIAKAANLPEYAEVRQKLQNLENSFRASSQGEGEPTP